jgi:hypothetical protein
MLYCTCYILLHTTALQIGAGMRDFRPHRFIVLEYLEAGTLAEKLSSGLPAGREESSYNKIVKSTKRYNELFNFYYFYYFHSEEGAAC